MKDKPENDVVYVKPPKPISEMSDEEIDEFVNTVWLSVSEGKQAGLGKASFGGDRSAAGRYAAEQRWKNHTKREQTLDNGAPMGYNESVDTKAEPKNKVEQWKKMLVVGNEVEIVAGGKAFIGEVADVTAKYVMIDTWEYEEDGRERRFWWNEIQEIKEVEENTEDNPENDDQ